MPHTPDSSCEIAAAASIARNVGDAPSRVEALMPHHVVILLLTGPAARYASALWLRIASAASLAGNCAISTLLGSTPYCRRDHLEQIDIGLGLPTTPMRRPASCWIS